MPELPGNLQTALDALRNYKPGKLVTLDRGSYPKLDPAVSFYDKHIDPRLALRRIILAPSLVGDIVAAGERALQSYKDRTDVELPAIDQTFLASERYGNDVVGARSIGLVYERGLGQPAAAFASMLLLHPNAPNWSCSMLFFESQYSEEKSDAFNDDYTPVLLNPSIDREAWGYMDENTRKRYNMAYKKFRKPAVWHMYFVRREARRALKRMDIVVSKQMPNYPTFRTDASKVGPGSRDLPFSPDALETAWGIPLSAYETVVSQASTSSLPLRRSKRVAANVVRKAKAPERPRLPRDKKKLASLPSSNSKLSREWAEVTCPISSVSVRTNEEVAASLLHRAWGSAVEKDATFIVLHCGTYERIAIRHRSTQTLFLSGLIDVNKGSDSSYGAIHIGLFISILSDVLDRAAQVEAKTSQTSRKRRRSAATVVEPCKRPRTRTMTAAEAVRKASDRKELQIMVDEISSRPLALLRMQYDRFNSPVPASFLRDDTSSKPVKSSYEPTEYFILTLTSYLGDGATGQIHTATVELFGSDGNMHSFSNAVVKFAFLPNPRQRLRHEFKVYQKLKASGITCIPEVFGLFKDVEGDTLALVMTHAGKCLADRRPDIQRSAFYVSKDERDQFVEALQSIHAQGFRHRDIRPENLLVSEDGSVKIIDFDRASLESSEDTREREMKHLMKVLDGRDFGAVGVASVSHGSFCESEQASTTTSRAWENSTDNSDITHRDSGQSEMSDASSVSTDTDLTEFF
ncbi:hypothetical protein H0H93_005933 [Arthromyces matolae]|nr:hypothetical protein H0H93_005933 [Arthromyces matolae]